MLVKLCGFWLKLRLTTLVALREVLQGALRLIKQSRLVCMFQDSVPAGSYNDPFLSSVIPMVAPTWCRRAS